MTTLAWKHKTDFFKGENTIVKQDYFVGVSDNNLQKMIGHTYLNNIVEVRERVEKYVGRKLHSNTHDSKIRAAYDRIKEPKFVTIKEILKILTL